MLCVAPGLQPLDGGVEDRLLLLNLHHFYICSITSPYFFESFRKISCVINKFFHQCSGSMTFWGGSGSGSADPCLWLMDPDPAVFVIDLQDASKKLIFNTIFSAYYFLKVHFHHFSKIKSQKESQNRRNPGFFLLFLHDVRRIRIRSRIRIHTSD